MTDLKIMELLGEFDPLLVGTVPIGIDLPDSDLDIICFAPDIGFFEEAVKQRLMGLSLHMEQGYTGGILSLTVQFTYQDWIIELFAQPVPTLMQNGWRHMIVEHRILRLWGEKARKAVMKYKLCGMKTEPAFGRLLGLEGDPYEELLRLNDWQDERLARHFNIKGEED
ncbi:DUF4269 domain-containing protein [Paenibacillus sp. DMB20]|uniref:DUF4269 domain-containing protein n=1 Tax=Paenibacillus sp. DMB20 TaxID=1642570 RepID=UPI002285439A|nr:DUF4269 domain-containing protein [Paenibacillus sp. DMB20]